MVTRRLGRGNVVWAQLDPVVGHEQAGHRPVLIVSEGRYNERSALTIVIPVTSQDKWQEPLQVALGEIAGKQAFALPGQMRTVSTERLGKDLGFVSQACVERCLDAFLQICGRPPRPRGENDAR